MLASSLRMENWKDKSRHPHGSRPSGQKPSPNFNISTKTIKSATEILIILIKSPNLSMHTISEEL